MEKASGRPGWWATNRGLNIKHLIVVAFANLMTPLSGITIMDTYLLDVFAASSIPPLTLLLVRIILIYCIYDVFPGVLNF